MPQMGESVTEGTILEWRKQEGDPVDQDEALVDVSTDKVDTEVPSPVAGTLTKILVQPDETVPVGTVLAEIEVNGAKPAAAEPPGASEPAQLVDVEFPQMGDSVTEGTVLEWLKKVGDEVALEEELVEISTDKVDAAMPSPVAGTLAEILVQADETVPTGTVLCRIAPGAVAAKPAEPKEPPASAAPTNGAAGATPVAARMAAANGIDLSALRGTGPRGRVLKEDVEAAIAGNGAAAPAPAAAPAEGSVKPIRGPAATLVRFMNESRAIPTATSFRTLDVDRLDARRKALKGAGQKLSFTHLIAWAIVQAARDMPVMAHAYAEQDGVPQRVTPAGVSLGLAVDVERKDGSRSLVVPVIRQADQLDFPTFAARYDEAVAGARDNTLSPEAYQGANITLTNPGGIGTVASVPRLMPGQGTIVATGAIGYPPGLTGVDPSKLRELGVSKVMTMTSTYDHRVIQGAESGAFLRRIDQLLQGEDGFYEAIFGALGVDAGGAAHGRRRGGHGRGARAAARHARRVAHAGRAGGHLARQGSPHARPPGGAARPARLGAGR